VCVPLDEPEPVDSVLTFLSGYDILEYSWVKATAISVRLGFYSWRCKVLTSFLAPLPENSSYIIFGLSRPRIFFFFFDSTSNPVIHGAAIPSTALFTQEWVLWASVFRWPHSYHQLWTQLKLYSLSLGKFLFRKGLWKSLPSSARIWASVLMLENFRHDTQNS